MREIIQEIVASPVPVVTYVTPSGGRAASAGFFILEAADVAAMAPATNTGASTPVAMFGEMDQAMAHKVQNDAAALIRGVATKRGRNAELAEKTVYEAKSFTDKEALDGHLIEIVAPSQGRPSPPARWPRDHPLRRPQADAAPAAPQVVDYSPSLRERFIAAIADPNLALILLILGALGVYVEFTHPGMIAPGVFGAILMVVGLSALSVLRLTGREPL